MLTRIEIEFAGKRLVRKPSNARFIRNPYSSFAFETFRFVDGLYFAYMLSLCIKYELRNFQHFIHKLTTKEASSLKRTLYLSGMTISNVEIYNKPFIITDIP